MSVKSKLQNLRETWSDKHFSLSVLNQLDKTMKIIYPKWRNNKELAEIKIKNQIIHQKRQSNTPDLEGIIERKKIKREQVDLDLTKIKLESNYSKLFAERLISKSNKDVIENKVVSGNLKTSHIQNKEDNAIITKSQNIVPFKHTIYTEPVIRFKQKPNSTNQRLITKSNEEIIGRKDVLGYLKTQKLAKDDHTLNSKSQSILPFKSIADDEPAFCVKSKLNIANEIPEEELIKSEISKFAENLNEEYISFFNEDTEPFDNNDAIMKHESDLALLIPNINNIKYDFVATLPQVTSFNSIDESTSYEYDSANTFNDIVSPLAVNSSFVIQNAPILPLQSNIPQYNYNIPPPIFKLPNNQVSKICENDRKFYPSFWINNIDGFPSMPNIGTDPRLLHYIPNPEEPRMAYIHDSNHFIQLDRLQSYVYYRNNLHAVRFVCNLLDMVIDGVSMKIAANEINFIHIRQIHTTLIIGGPFHEVILNGISYHVPMTGLSYTIYINNFPIEISFKVRNPFPLKLMDPIPKYICEWAEAGYFGTREVHLPIQNPLIFTQQHIAQVKHETILQNYSNRNIVHHNKRYFPNINPSLMPQSLAEVISQTSTEMISHVKSPIIPQGIQPIIPQGIPQMMPQGISQIMPQDIPQMMPHGIPQMMPHGIPQMMPHGIPQMMPHGIPQMMPHGIPQMMPHGIPQMMPHGIPQMMPHGIPQMSQDIPQMMPQDIPQMIPQGIPQMMPHGIPKMMPHGIPQIMPQGIPLIMSHGIPHMIPNINNKLFGKADLPDTIKDFTVSPPQCVAPNRENLALENVEVSFDNYDTNFTIFNFKELANMNKNKQCNECGLRLKDLKLTDKHLDQHFIKNSTTYICNRSRGYYQYKDLWVLGVTQGDDHDENMEKTEQVKKCPAFNDINLNNCSVCYEKIKTEWDDDQNSYMLIDAVLKKGAVYHSICYEDAPDKDVDTTSTEPELDNGKSLVFENKRNPNDILYRLLKGEFSLPKI